MKTDEDEQNERTGTPINTLASHGHRFVQYEVYSAFVRPSYSPGQRTNAYPMSHHGDQSLSFPLSFVGALYFLVPCFISSIVIGLVNKFDFIARAQ